MRKNRGLLLHAGALSDEAQEFALAARLTADGPAIAPPAASTSPSWFVEVVLLVVLAVAANGGGGC